MASSKLRPDEQFVMNCLAERFAGRWRDGENPPDAYLAVMGKEVAVEVTTLTQHVRNRRGQSVPRLFEDSTALRVIHELNEEMGNLIPDGLAVTVVMVAPITNARKMKPELQGRLANCLSLGVELEVADEIAGNRVTITISGASGHPQKVFGIISNANSRSDILSNAWEILEDRISTKAKKCSHLPSTTPKWLALFNDYWLADYETYQQAFCSFSVTHPFEKILLVAGDKTVAVLYARET